MKRRDFILAMAGGLAAATPALASEYADGVVRQLRQQGYVSISVATTLLGRTRITATRRGGTREIILNPKTGEILRDLWVAADGSVGGIGIIGDDAEGGNGRGGDTDDDDDEDNSGSGGGGGDDDDGDD